MQFLWWNVHETLVYGAYGVHQEDMFVRLKVCLASTILSCQKDHSIYVHKETMMLKHDRFNRPEIMKKGYKCIIHAELRNSCRYDDSSKC